MRAGHLASEALSGEYLSAFKGKGMEFDDIREYFPGDDVRAIDWNVTARMNQPFIKEFREEREMTMILIVDVSPSQEFGTTGRDKNEVAAEFAAILAFLAVRNNDKVGLLLFSDHLEHYIPPKKGRGHIWNIIRDVLEHRGSGKDTQIDIALQHLMAVTKRKALCFLISDFYADGYFKIMGQVAKRHDLVCVQVTDPREYDMPPVGLLEIVGSESEEHFVLDTSSPATREFIKGLSQERVIELKGYCKKQGIDFVDLHTDGDMVNSIAKFLKGRERRRFR